MSEQAIAKLKKELDSVKGNKAFTKIIHDHLVENIEEISQRVNLEEKTLPKCITHITNMAKEQAVNNCAAVKDEVVFNWAIEYYKSDTLEKQVKEEKVEIKTPKKAEETPQTKDTKNETDREKEKTEQEDPQISLFDMMR